jgi:hypothetical protein
MGTRRLKNALPEDFIYKNAENWRSTGMVQYEGENPLYSISQLTHARHLACMHACHLAIMHELENRERTACEHLSDYSYIIYMINMYIISILEAARNKIIQWLIIIFYI